MQEMPEQKQRSYIFLLLVVILLVLFFVQLLDFESSDHRDTRWATLPVSIRAGSQADYSRDSDAFVVPPIYESIFEQIIRDMQGTGDPEDRMSTLQVSLSMPVPTMTLNPQMSTPTWSPFTPISSNVGTTTPQATASPQISDTLVASTTTGTFTYGSPTPSGPTPTSVPPPTKKPRPTQRPRPTKRP